MIINITIILVFKGIASIATTIIMAIKPVIMAIIIIAVINSAIIKIIFVMVVCWFDWLINFMVDRFNFKKISA